MILSALRQHKLYLVKRGKSPQQASSLLLPNCIVVLLNYRNMRERLVDWIFPALCSSTKWSCEFCAFAAWTKGSTRLPRRIYAGSSPACLPRHHGTQSLAYARLERHKRSVIDKGREIRERGRDIQK